MSRDADELFWEAREITEPERRAAFLAASCGDSPDVLARVKALLADEAQANDYFAGMEGQAGGLGGESEGGALPAVPGEREGQRIGRYRLVEQIGEGGFGTVWMAEQTEPVTRRVALKIIKPGMDTREVIARFETERQVLAMMAHPNIAKVLDAGATDSGRPFFVMELVKGLPVTDFCRQCGLGLEERLRLFREICAGVHHAHQKGIIHRDIKPSNVMVTRQGDRPVPMVIDFGIAKAMGSKLTAETLVTRQDQLLGTPVYMSPEQATLGRFDVDIRSDIYALGILLYELLTGMPPFDVKALLDSGFDEMRRIIREQDPPKPSARLAAMAGGEAGEPRGGPRSESARWSRLIRGELDWIVMKAICKDRDRRYQSANGLALDVQRFLAGEPVTAAPPGVVYQVRKTWQRHRVAFVAVGSVAVSLLIGTGVSLREAFRATRAEGLAADRLRLSEEARRTAEGLSLENRERLVHIHRASGIERMLEGHAALALPWLAKALELEDGQPEEQRLDRLRIGQILKEMPQLRRFWTKPGQALQVGFSPDGNYALALASTVTGILYPEGGGETWHVPTGRTVSLPTDKREWLHADFSPDSRRLASVTRSGVVTIWDLETGQPAVRFPEPHPDGYHVLFSPDGTRLLTYGRNGLAKVWDAEAGTVLIPRLEIQSTASVHWAEFHPEGRQVSILDGRGAVWTFDTVTGTLVSSVPPQGWGVGFRLQYSPDGSFLATASGDFHTVRTWDSRTGEGRVTLRHGNPVSSFDISPDGNALAAAVRDFGGAVQVWDPRTGRPITPPVPQEAPVEKVRFSPDSKYLVTAGWDHAARIYDARTGLPVGSPLWHTAAVQSVAFHPSGRYVLTGCVDGTVRIWALSTERAPVLAVRPRGQVEHLAFDPTGQRLLAGTADGHVQMWRTDDGRELIPSAEAPVLPSIASFLPGPHLVPFLNHEPVAQFWRPEGGAGGEATSAAQGGPDLAGGFLPVVAVTPGGARAVVLFPRRQADRSGFQVWNLARGELVADVLLESPTPLFRLSPDGGVFAIVQRQGDPSRDTLGFWSAQTGERIGGPIALDGFVASGLGAFSPDGTVLALVTQSLRDSSRPDSNLLQFWEVATGSMLRAPLVYLGVPGLLRYGPAGDRIALRLGDRLCLIDVGTGRQATPPIRHRREVAILRFSPDGRFVCSLDRTEFLYLHEAAHGQPISQPIRHPGKVLDARFTPSGTRVVSICEDGWIRFWDLEAEARSIPELALQAQLQSGHAIDETGTLSPLSTVEYARQWESWLRLRPERLGSFGEDVGASGDSPRTDAADPALEGGAAFEEWSRLEGPVVTVSADPRVENPTGIRLGPGDRYRLVPCPTDRWNTSPLRWSDVDFRGHIRRQEATATGRPFMQLCYAVGNRDLQAVDPGKVVTGAGDLLVVPSDVEGGGTAGNNRGSIRVKIVRVEESGPVEAP